MSAAGKLPAIAGTLGLGALLAGIASVPAVRETLTKYLGAKVTNNMWKIVALALATTSIKNVPFAWHVSTGPPRTAFTARRFIDEERLDPSPPRHHLPALLPTHTAIAEAPFRAPHHILP